MAISIVYAAMTPGWKNAKIGQSDGSVAGTSPKITMGAQYTDPRVNAFSDGSGTPLVDLCNRAGDTEDPGTGTHWVLGFTNGSLPSSLPGVTSGLSRVANPYAISQPYNGYIYIADYDFGRLMAFAENDSSYTVLAAPAYTFTKVDYTSMAIDLEVVDDNLYGLFSSAEDLGWGTWTTSTVVKLEPSPTPSQPHRLASIGQASVGKNASGMTVVKDYTPTGAASASTYLLVSCVGGNQQYGAGNGVNSVVDVVETGSNFGKVGTALVGTYARNGVMTLDIKSVSATPTVSNDAYVYIMASSILTSTGLYKSRWITCQTKASTLIQAAINSSPINLTPGINNMVEVDGSGAAAGDYGAFWTAVYVQDGSVASINGKLIVGHGVGNGGDNLDVYSVGSTGVTGSATSIPASTYYGASGIINTLTVVPPPAAAPGAKMKVLRSVTPPPAMATSMSHTGEFLPNILKKLQEEQEANA